MASARHPARHWCPACQQAVAGFGPGGPKGRPNAKCPHCGALERHRYLALLLDQHGPLLATSDVVLDIAPQKQVAALLRQLAGPAYLATDLFAHLDIDVRTDLTRMPLRSGSVDVVICYHVLEHIPDDEAAMRELARILKPGGVLFMQVPWRPGRPTDEDPSASVEERLRRFGQDDHVRWYGDDLEVRLARNGLRPGRIRPATTLTEEQLACYGITPKEFMWVCRPMAPEVLDGNPELLGQRRIDSSSTDLHRVEIDRLRHETVRLRAKATAVGAEHQGSVGAQLQRGLRSTARQVYRRAVRVEALAPTANRAAAVVRRVEASRRRRRRAALAAASKAKGSDPSHPAAQPVSLLADPTADPARDRSVVSATVVETVEQLDRWRANPTFADLDLVLSPAPVVAAAVDAGTHQVAQAGGGPQLAAVAAAHAQATRIALCIATPDRAQAPGWGDTHLARDLQKALRRRGHPTRVLLRDEFEGPGIASAHVVVHIAGRAVPLLRRGQINVLWIISHPGRLPLEQIDRYDLVLVASHHYAAHLRSRVSAPVFPLLQATDPNRFAPDPTGPPHPVLFVGNSRLTSRRRIIDDLTPTRLDLSVYGRDWAPDFIDPRHVKGTHVPNDRLAAFYSSAGVVLNDHWPEMAREGFVSNRLYDALACGAFVISDHVDGLAEELDDGVVTYTDRKSLEPLIRRWLADEPGRRAIAERGRAKVLAAHTFDHRAARLLALVEPLLDGPLQAMPHRVVEPTAASVPTAAAGGPGAR